jgi:hypothetical protein
VAPFSVESNRYRQQDADRGVHKTAGRQDPRLGELQRTILVAADHESSRMALASLLAAAGDRLEVQITSTGTNCNNKQRQVRFRY